MKPNTKILTTFLLLSAGTLLLALTTQQSSAATITVDDDGPADYSKIQYAIDNATEGDTILVKEETYYENVLVNKTVSLIGDGSENTTIDGGGDMLIEGNTPKLQYQWLLYSGDF